MARAIAGREDVRVRGARVLVDADAVRAREAGALRELDVRHDADADDGGVAAKARPVSDLDRLDAFRAVQGAYGRAAVDRDAGLRVCALVELRHLAAHDAREQTVRSLEHRHGEAALARDRRDLEPDVAPADHDDSRRSAATTR